MRRLIAALLLLSAALTLVNGLLAVEPTRRVRRPRVRSLPVLVQ